MKDELGAHLSREADKINIPLQYFQVYMHIEMQMSGTLCVPPMV